VENQGVEAGSRGAEAGERDSQDGVGVYRGCEARPPTQVITTFIDAYKDLFGVEPICRVLEYHNLPIAPSTYYTAKTGPPSARHLSDEKLLEDVKWIYRENYGVYGIRKVWHALQR